MIDVFTFECFKEYPNILQAVTTKSSDHPYDFSLALHTGEEEKKIIENRQKIVVSLFSKEKNLHFIVANQTHSDHIAVVTEAESRGWESFEESIADCDALITEQKNVMLTILTADCVPILLYDPVKQVVAAVHAGWKGTKAHIVAKTVKKMQTLFGSENRDIIAGIAPSIGRCCYKVGEEVAEHFFDTPEGFTKKGRKYMLDLPYINKYQLLEAGLLESHIEMSHICTACEVEAYFSYRKEQGCSGRFMSMIGMV